MKKLLNFVTGIIFALIFTLSASAQPFLVNGIDVSRWQGEINWGKVAETDKEFAIIRLGYNDIQDVQFEANYTGAKAAGIPVGAYMYSYAVTEQAAIEEAYIVLDRIRGKQFEYPIYLDVEDKKLLDKQYNLTKEQRTKNVLAFVRTMQSNGYYVGVYSNLDWFTNYLDLAKIQAECETWIAHYDTSLDYSNSKFGMLQHSKEGSVDGIVGNVDLNICYRDYPSIIKKGGYNGFIKPHIYLNPTGVKGDLNADKKLGLEDITVLSQYVANWEGLSFVKDELNANGDAEGVTDLSDVIYLSRLLLAEN